MSHIHPIKWEPEKVQYVTVTIKGIQAKNSTEMHIQFLSPLVFSSHVNSLLCSKTTNKLQTKEKSYLVCNFQECLVTLSQRQANKPHLLFIYLLLNLFPSHLSMGLLWAAYMWMDKYKNYPSFAVIMILSFSYERHWMAVFQCSQLHGIF